MLRRAFLRALRRYVLAPPVACKQLEILEDRDHPSFRHSITDWSDPKDYMRAGYDRTVGIDTIVRTGEVRRRAERRARGGEGGARAPATRARRARSRRARCVTAQVLYIPSYWFHYIISLKYSAQCNTRSGSPPERNGESHIKECMGTRNFKDSPGAKVGKESFEQTSERRKRRDKRKEEEERAQRHALFKRGAGSAKSEAE